jgi:hypothetical protein
MFIKTLWYGLPFMPIPDPDGWGTFLYYVLSIPVIAFILLLKVITYFRTKIIQIYFDLLLFILYLFTPFILINYCRGLNWYSSRYIIIFVLFYSYFIDFLVFKHIAQKKTIDKEKN